MKRFTCILLLFAGVLAQAQVRTYSENASKTFVVGLDSYFYGDAGSLSFEAAGQSFRAASDWGPTAMWSSASTTSPETTCRNL